MGLENRESGNFITILGGKFCQRVPAGTPGAKERTNKNNKVVHEKFYDSFTGKLVGIKIQDGEYGKNWLFSFKDSGEIYHLQLSYSNSFAVALLKMLPNVDLTKEMKVSPSTKEVDGKNKSSLFISQGGEYITHAFTRENPNGMPNLKKVVIKGQDVWDDTERLAFLEKMVNEIIVPKLEGVPASADPEKSEADKAFDAIGSEQSGGEEDVPF